MVLRSTGRDATEEIFPDPLTYVQDDEVNPADKTSSGGDTIVPEVFESENESPWGGKYNLRPNPTPNFTDEHRYHSDIINTGPYILF